MVNESVRAVMVVGLLGGVLLFPGCREDQRDQETNQDPATPAMPIGIDGKAEDWAGVEPVLQEAGKAGSEKEFGFDIKQVYLQADTKHLYVFARCTPTVQQEFEQNPDPSGGELFKLYLDVDNDERTGASENLGRIYEAVGYDRRLWFTVGLTTGGGKPARDPTATVHAFPNLDFRAARVWASTSSDDGAMIAHGPDGVEAAIPLDVIDIEPGTTVRLLLWESANFANLEAFNEFTFVLSDESAQQTD